MKTTRKISIAFIALICCILGSLSSQAQENENWQYMGKVHASYSNGYDYKTWPSQMGDLYSSFDGKSISYKLIIGGEILTAYKNPSFSQSRYDSYVEASSKDHFRGPHLKNAECYPYRAGKYYFNPANAFNR